MLAFFPSPVSTLRTVPLGHMLKTCLPQCCVHVEAKNLLFFSCWQLFGAPLWARRPLPEPTSHRAFSEHPTLTPTPAMKRPRWTQSALASVTWGVRLQASWLRISPQRPVSAHTRCDISVTHVGPSGRLLSCIVYILTTCCGAPERGCESTQAGGAGLLWVTPELLSEEEC